MEELSNEAMFGSDFGAERMWGLKEVMLEAEKFSPQTIAWLWLLALVSVVIMIVCWRRYQYWKSQAYRREALKSLALMRTDNSQLGALPRLLRYAALQSAPRNEVIAASGADWIDWLNQKAGKTIFNKEDATLLSQLAYADKTEVDQQQGQHLINATEAWIGGHHA